MEQIVETDENLLSGTVHRDVLVIFRSKEYLQLADHLKASINLSWRALVKGRTVHKVVHGDQTIFLLTVDPAASQVGSILDEQSLDEAFSEVGGIGRVSSDPYELKLAHKLVGISGTRVQ
jgi:hypothetical protein